MAGHSTAAPSLVALQFSRRIPAAARDPLQQWSATRTYPCMHAQGHWSGSGPSTSVAERGRGLPAAAHDRHAVRPVSLAKVVVPTPHPLQPRTDAVCVAEENVPGGHPAHRAVPSP